MIATPSAAPVERAVGRHFAPRCRAASSLLPAYFSAMGDGFQIHVAHTLGDRARRGRADRAPVDPNDWCDAAEGSRHECLARAIHLGKREIELAPHAAVPTIEVDDPAARNALEAVAAGWGRQLRG